MANSLMDLFSGSQQQPQDNLQQGGGISGMSNSLVGLGMGLLQPYNPWAGTNAWSNALQGYQTGAALDQRTRQQQQQLAMEQARLKLAQQSANKEPEAVRLWKLSEGNPAMRSALFPKADAGWKLWSNPDDDQTYWVNDKGEAHPFRLGQPPGSAGAAAVPSPVPSAQSPAPVVDTATDFTKPAPLPDQPPAQPTQPPALKRQFEPEEKLRKEFLANTKVHNEVRQSYQRVLSSKEDAAGDLALIFGYMKMLDPGSVVRETEFANAQNAAGVPDMIRNMYNRILSGERLNPNQREQFKGQAGSIYNKYQQEYDAFANHYGTIARQYRLEPSRVIPDYGPRPQVAPPSQVTPSPTSGAQAAPAAPAARPKIPRYNPQTGKFE